MPYWSGAITVGSDNTIYLAGPTQVLRMRIGATLSVVAGRDSPFFSGDGGPATSAQMNGPHGLTVDPANNLYIADTDNHVIRKVTTDGIIASIAGAINQLIQGIPAQDNPPRGLGDGGPATAAKLGLPVGVAVDRDGNVYIADMAQNRIRMVSGNGTISTIAGTGVQGFSGDRSVPTEASLSVPENVLVGPCGDVYIADTLNHRVRKIASSHPTCGPASCAYKVGATTLPVVAASGGTLNLAISAAPPMCPWTAAADRDWIAVSPATGTGDGTITIGIQSNTAALRTGTLTVAGQRIAITQTGAPPQISAVANGASLAPTSLTPDSWAALFGNALAPGTDQATTPTLPFTLGGTSLTLKDNAGSAHALPLLFVSPTQVNFYIPGDVVQGVATLGLKAANGADLSTPVTVTGVAPGIFTANGNGSGPVLGMVAWYGQGDVQTEDAFDCSDGLGNCKSRPLTISQSDNAYLTAYGTGFQHGRVTAVQIGGVRSTVAYAGRQGNYPGLDQLNVQLSPMLAGRGEVDVLVTVDGIYANPTMLWFRGLSSQSSILITSSLITTHAGIPANCRRPADHPDLSNSAEDVAVWFAYQGGKAGEYGTLDWYDPNGKLFTHSQFSPQPEEGGSWCSWWWIPVAGNRIGATPGEWTVNLKWNGVPQFTIPFRISQ